MVGGAATSAGSVLKDKVGYEGAENGGEVVGGSDSECWFSPCE